MLRVTRATLSQSAQFSRSVLPDTTVVVKWIRFSWVRVRFSWVFRAC